MAFFRSSAHLVLLAVLLNLPMAANAIELNWWGLPPKAVVDAPEYARTIIPIPAAAETPGVATPLTGLLSGFRGLFYLNVYRDQDYRERLHKLGPIPLLSGDEFRSCITEFQYLNLGTSAARTDIAPGIVVDTLSFECAKTNGWESKRYLLIDWRAPGTPLLALGRVRNDHLLSFQPLQDTPAPVLDSWLKGIEGARNAMRYRVPDAPLSIEVDPRPYLAGDGALQLWELHRQLSTASDKGPGLKKVDELFLNQDFRRIGADQPEFIGQLNDIAYWKSQLAPDEGSRQWLLEVVRRAPQRIPVYLNLADQAWKAYEKSPAYTTHYALAQEYYRIYCGLRLQRNLSVPERVLKNLGLTQADPQACQAQWPLIEAVDNQDEPRVRQLLDSGLQAKTLGEDGRSALLRALDAPNFPIARLLLERGAATSGINGSEPLVMQAFNKDIKADANPERAQRTQFLLAAGAAIDEPDASGQTLLMQRASVKDSAAFNWLLNYPQDLDRREDREQKTALYEAIYRNNYPAAKRLVEAGAKLNLVYPRGRCTEGDRTQSALFLLASQAPREELGLALNQQQTLELFTLMLDKGADPTLGRECSADAYSELRKVIGQRQRPDLLEALERHAPEADKAVTGR
ncbi:ankyrin repeat domain-containing protein [Pseudomonas sp. TWP3-2]|uniref:ankyrin repeat domain-containing protein n=1 Tax=Pseudomonas sp. TWP3-2 TaxID=2804574 RepID=UPI003CE7DE41